MKYIVVGISMGCLFLTVVFLTVNAVNNVLNQVIALDERTREEIDNMRYRIVVLESQIERDTP